MYVLLQVVYLYNVGLFDMTVVKYKIIIKNTSWQFLATLLLLNIHHAIKIHVVLSALNGYKPGSYNYTQRDS